MHPRLRLLSVPTALALVAGLFAAPTFAAGQPLLTGDVAAYSNSAASGEPRPLPTDVGTLTMASTCDPGSDDETPGSGSFSSLLGTGNVNGPYAGTFTISGAGSIDNGIPDSLSLSFEIRDVIEPSVIVAAGSLALDYSGPDGTGNCYTQVDVDEGETMVVWQARGFATYSATVNAGGTFAPELGWASWYVACITINSEPACDSSETIVIRFLGATLPRSASGEGAAQTAATATTDDPIATSVVSPAGGWVSIEESAVQPNDTDAFTFLGRQVSISVYGEEDEVLGTPEAPINLTFMVDESLLEGIDWQTVTVVRDEAAAPDCTSPDPATGLSDPEAFCVSSRTLDETGDLTLEILSLHASTWSVVAPIELPQYVFSGFAEPVHNPGGNATRNLVKAGQVVPLVWRLTDEDGGAVLNLESAAVTVVGFECGLRSSSDLPQEKAAGKTELQNLGNGYYQFNWKSPKSYANSCKELTLTLSVDGQTITGTALFQFKK